MQPTHRDGGDTAHSQMFGRDSELRAFPFVVAMFIRLTNTAEAWRSTMAAPDPSVTTPV